MNAPTLACTFSQYFSSRTSGLNHTARMRIGPKIQMKGLGSSTTFQDHNRKPEVLSRLIFAPVFFSSRSSIYYITSMSLTNNTKNDTLTVHAKTWARFSRAKHNTHRARLHAPVLLPAQDQPQRQIITSGRQDPVSVHLFWIVLSFITQVCSGLKTI